MEPKTQQFVICPKCNEPNLPDNAFCKKCGEILKPTNLQVPQDVDEPAKSSKLKIILIVLGILSFLAAAAGGAYYWYDFSQKKVAKQFLSTSSSGFGKVISSINALSTENEIEQKDDSDELYIKKLQEEKNKTEIAAKEVVDAKAQLERVSKNKLVNSFDQMQSQFYEEAGKKIEIYDGFIGYSIKISQGMSTFSKEEKKVEDNNNPDESIQDFSNSLKQMRDVVDNSNNELKNITPPEGLKEAHEKIIQYFTDISLTLTSIIQAVEAQNMDQFLSSLKKMEDLAGSKTFQDVDKLVEYYFNDLHGQFVSLREKADNIKTEFINYKNRYRADVKDFTIEGW